MRFFFTTLLVSISIYCFPQKSITLYKRGELREAEQYSLTQVREYQSSSSANNGLKKGALYKRIAPYHTLGMIERVRGNFRRAFYYFDKADSALRVYGAYKANRTLFNYGTRDRMAFWRFAERQVEKTRIHLSLGNFEEAKKNLDAGGQVINKNYGQTIIPIINQGYADYFESLGSYDSSIYYRRRFIVGLFSNPNVIEYTVHELGEAYLGLSSTYVKTGKYDLALRASYRAERYSRHRFTRWSVGKNFVGRVVAINQVAEVLRLQGNIESSKAWSDRAQKLYDRSIRMDVPEKVPMLATRGQLQWVMGDTAQAKNSFGELIKVYFDYVQRNFSYLSEGERSFFYHNNRHYVDLARGFYAAAYFKKGQRYNSVARTLYEASLNNKGILMNASHRLLEAVYASEDQQVHNQFNEISFIREDLARAQQSGNSEKSNVLSRELADREKQLRDQLAIPGESFVRFQDIALSVPDSVNLVDIFTCPRFSVATDKQSGVVCVEQEEGHDYLYFIFKGNNTFTLTANPVDGRDLENRYYRGFLNSTKHAITDSTLEKVYFTPIKRYLSRNKIVYSADGVYAVLNPELLYDGREYLVNKYEFYPVVSSRDLLTHRSRQPITSIGLVGAPDFSTLKNTSIDPPPSLPGAQREIEAIANMLPIEVKRQISLKGDATEKAIKSLQKESILHIATHGFFSSSTGVNPMFTTGLILAQSSDGSDDGLLTAYEASNLDLSETFLVVLSACETGQGQFEESEGVWGLQRAFQVAGVRYVVMSLFKVDDDVTALLMREFYSRLFKGQSVLQAFREAREVVKRTATQPYHWGAFIIKGI